MFYAKKIRDTTIPLVLSRIADVINKRDYNLMDELMTPYLAKLYKHAVANMDAQGFRIKLEIDVQMPGARNDYMWIKQGDPEAFDYTIPFPIRNSKYAVGRGEKTAVAANKDKDGMVSHGASKAPIYSSWIGFEFGFVVNAHVKVDLYKGKRIIDSDSGVMPIPIAISTPHYLDMHVMANVVSAGEGSENEEPFRWRVCDLFYIADSDNANNAAQANKKKIE
ncbi:hypothetical protein GGI23_000773 [Coemansia sp. RSA 2559]|nr:hypothetical protein GGI23_000773 [Coemansia sp. RSA 2559]KAJ2868788.1 hypothetical protein GGI22_000642 [Coemansia erecta]